MEAKEHNDEIIREYAKTIDINSLEYKLIRNEMILMHEIAEKMMENQITKEELSKALKIHPNQLLKILQSNFNILTTIAHFLKINLIIRHD